MKLRGSLKKTREEILARYAEKEDCSTEDLSVMVEVVEKIVTSIFKTVP